MKVEVTPSSVRAHLATAMRTAAALVFLIPSATVLALEDDGPSKRPREVLTIKGDARYITFSPDGNRLAGNVPGAIWRPTDIKVWEVSSGGEILKLTGHKGGIWELSYDANGKRLASNDNYMVKIWDLGAGKEFRSFNMPAFTRTIVFTADGTQVATGHDDGKIRLWDVETSRLTRVLTGHTDWVPSLALSPDGKRLASGSVDRTARLWDLASGREVLSLRGHGWYLNSVAFGPNGRRLISGSDDLTARVWNLETGQALITLRGHEDWVRRVAFSPDGKWVATASSDHTAKVWNASTGKEVAKIDQHADEVSGLAFSPDGSRLATASQDGTIKLWDVLSFAEDESAR